MKEIVYTSTPWGLVFDDDVLNIVRVSRRTNAAVGVTGFLVYDGSMFLQVIEGEDAIVDRLAARILRDDRHSGVHILSDTPIAKRSFARWSMGYRAVKPGLDTMGALPAAVPGTPLGPRIAKAFAVMA